MTATELDADRQVLSREELSALLADLADRQQHEERARHGSRPFAGGAGGKRPARLAPLLRSLEGFGDELARALSSLHQVPLEWRLLEWEELAPREFAETLHPTDLVFELELSPGAERAWLLIGRSLAYGWLSLAFGARPGRVRETLPERPYTRIERRFLRRAAEEVLRQLDTHVGESWRLSLRLGALVEPEALAELRGGPRLAVSFAVRGLGELGRLRLLLPPEAFDAASEPASTSAAGTADVEAALLAMPVAVSVEAGEAELPLARLAALAPGDLIPLQPADPDGLLVRIGGEPRFRAQRGRVGTRLAVQITGRVGEGAG